jgi:hypothetical protein
VASRIDGIPQLRARLKAMRPDRELMAKLALTAIREQKILVPRKTGNLGRSIRLGAITPTMAETVATASYAAYVERGTRPHEIRPRNRKALRWAAGSARLSGTPRSGGQVRFAKRVQHPGTKAKPFMLPGAQKALRDVGLKNIVVEAWNDAA